MNEYVLSIIAFPRTKNGFINLVIENLKCVCMIDFEANISYEIKGFRKRLY